MAAAAQGRRLGAVHAHLQQNRRSLETVQGPVSGSGRLQMPPVIDVSALIDSSTHRHGRIEALAQIDNAFRCGSGAFVATGHGLSSSLRAVMRGSQEFFDAPVELQRQYMEGKYFAPVGTAKIAVRPSTLHERLSYPRVCYRDEGIEADEIKGTSNGVAANLNHDSPCIFDSFPGLDSAFRAYQKGLRQFVRVLLRAIAELLGIDGAILEAGWRDTSAGITCLHYPQVTSRPSTDGLAALGNDPREYNGMLKPHTPAAGARDSSARRPGSVDPRHADLGATMRAYPHADGDTMLTILGHDRSEGLELLVRGATVADDQWVSAPDIDGGLVVQLGQMMQRLTNDVYLATPHRVVLPPTGTVPQRMSVVMFFRPGLEVVINPPASLVDRHKNALGYAYEPITVAEFLTMPRSDEAGKPLKLTSNVLKDGRWIGARVGASLVPNAP